MKYSFLLALTLTLALPVHPKTGSSSDLAKRNGDQWVWGAAVDTKQPPATKNDDEWSGNRFYWPQAQSEPQPSPGSSSGNANNGPESQFRPQTEYSQPQPQPQLTTFGQPPANDEANARILKLKRKNGVYTTSLNLGSLATPKEFVVSTGSSDIWVNTQPGPGDVYDYSQSSFFKRLESAKPFRTGDGGDNIFGFWGSDAISVFGSKFRSNIGFAESSSKPNMLGLGPKQGEELADVTYDGFASNTYPNLPILLQERRVIDQAAYSLWLNAESEPEGELLFGAVDHAKYAGALQKVPIVDGATAAGNPAQTNSVLLNSISTDSYTDEINLPITLDSSMEYTQLPMSLYQGLALALDAYLDWDSGNVFVDCQSESEVKFNFSGINIAVKAKDLLQSPDSEGRCALPVRPRTNLVLGNTFLKNFYTVYDMENREIAIASALHGEDANRHQFEQITAGIPSATPAPNYSSTEYGAPIRNPWQGMW